MAPNTGSIADFHPADTTFNPAIQRNRGRPAAYRRSPLSAELNTEALSTPETPPTAQSNPEARSTLGTPATDRSNRPRLTINTNDLSTSPESVGDEADTPHPSQDDGSSPTDQLLDSSSGPHLPATTDTSGSVSPVSPTNDNDVSPSETVSPVSPTKDDDRATADRPLSPVSPIDGPSTVGPHVRFADESNTRLPLTPLQQHREALRTLTRAFDTHILEPGEGEAHWMRFRGALQPAAETLATDQIIHALKHHLPSVQETLSQNAQLRGALAETQARQDASEVEVANLREENRGLRGALDRLQIPGEGGEQVRDLTIENEQLKIELEKAQKELQESFDEREIEEGNLKFEITAGEEALAALQREHDAVLADRQLLRTQAQQAAPTVQRAQQEARIAGREAASLRAQLRDSQATSTATAAQVTMLERQVMEAHSVGWISAGRSSILNLDKQKGSSEPQAAIPRHLETRLTPLSHQNPIPHLPPLLPLPQGDQHAPQPPPPKTRTPLPPPPPPPPSNKPAATSSPTTAT